jgi:retinol dehydrogenase-12
MPSVLSIAFPPAPKFTPANLPSLAGKVFIVTGAASGVGFELAKIIYAAGGVVYIAARSAARCQEAITKIPKQQGPGRLESLVVDLADLRTIKGACEEFLAKEQRLDVLVHNAGVMTPPSGSVDAQVLLQ